MSVQNVTLKRFYSTDKFTIGGFFFDGVFQCFSIEDSKKEKKVMHQTRIPAGRYRLTLQKSGNFHERYKKRFSFHDGMILVNSVPGFTGILIHLGNSSKNTSGCILPGMSHKACTDFIGSSAIAYEKIYIPLRDALKSGKIIHLSIVDD